MSYSGFLIKINGTTDYIVPLTYMDEKSYKGTLSVVDLEGWRDADKALLHRTAVNQVPHCSFTTRALTNREIGEIWQNISSRYTKPIEKKFQATIYIMEQDAYYTGSFYIPDTEMTIQSIKDGVIKYEPVTYELIAYGDGSIA
jgi:hypothetical protein